MTHEEKIKAFIKQFGHSEFQHYTFPKTFGSTSGPFGGIGGSAMTTFTMEAFVCQRTGEALLFCQDRIVKAVKNFSIGSSWS